MVRVNCQNGDGGGSWIGDFRNCGGVQKSMGHKVPWKIGMMISANFADFPFWGLLTLSGNSKEGCWAFGVGVKGVTGTDAIVVQ